MPTIWGHLEKVDEMSAGYPQIRAKTSKKTTAVRKKKK